MRLAVAKGRRICFANAVEMRTLCGLKRGTRERMNPTPVVVTPVEDFVPEGAPISDDDDSVVSSV